MKLKELVENVLNMESFKTENVIKIFPQHEIIGDDALENILDKIKETNEFKDIELYDRPKSQGGTWVLAQRMKVIEEMDI